jgi:hypothetical protein
MLRTLRTPSLAAVALVTLGGCSLSRDPMEQPGTWQSTGANAHNLQAMVVNPDHLDRGVGSSTSRAQPASLAATRLFTDRRRRLPQTTTSQVGSQGQGPRDQPITGPGSGYSNASGGAGSASR